MDRLIAQYGLALVLRERAARAARAADSGDPGARRRRRALGRGNSSRLSRLFGRRVRRVHDGRRGLVSRGQALRPPRDEAPVPGVPFSRFLCAPDGVPLRALGKLTLVVSKFIPGLSTISAALAGATRLGWPSFLFFNGAGVVIWAGTAIRAGMLFHAQINEFIVRLEGLGTLAAEAIGVLARDTSRSSGGAAAVLKMLRIARIGVDELRALTKGDRRPVVVDVRSSSARDLDPRFIPGALAMTSPK